jgi:PKD repeat protein
MVNLPYSAESSFTDPGKPDHQTARLDMGDGTIIQSSAFDLFSDAFGGVAGQVSHRHKFRTSGTYTVALEVKDNDGGATTTPKTITVVTPADVVKLVIKEIDLLLATTTDQKVIRALRDARDNLLGNNNGSAHNGALDARASGDLTSALEKIKAAIEALVRAETAGAGDLSKLKNLLGFTGESIAQGAYQDAIEAVGTPSAGQATQLQRISQSITDGHARLVNSEYLSAIDLFKDAVGRALSLL